ncbi:hypothetical protein H696_04948 [Fonticula alba]|uniref:Uncharacterized protein n=1 Tax=Fonticula alba TaxID=691883 RepID=A0A058Z559_FONAL|nr:hypothetical protein H696_04948 [Fonticula alba]KCV68657.1 hypothetical protein H696_04948 [Fonticula alba]|eukprot:XP_009497089.1 hypothetical protein H696_04948 [Fonticula alba]
MPSPPRSGSSFTMCMARARSAALLFAEDPGPTAGALEASLRQASMYHLSPEHPARMADLRVHLRHLPTLLSLVGLNVANDRAPALPAGVLRCPVHRGGARCQFDRAIRQATADVVADYLRSGPPPLPGAGGYLPLSGLLELLHLIQAAINRELLAIRLFDIIVRSGQPKAPARAALFAQAAGWPAPLAPVPPCSSRLTVRTIYNSMRMFRLLGLPDVPLRRADVLAMIRNGARIDARPPGSTASGRVSYSAFRALAAQAGALFLEDS